MKKEGKFDTIKTAVNDGKSLGTVYFLGIKLQV
jgi:hypothetical protein